MRNSFAKVLLGLKDFAQGLLLDIDELATGHQEWLCAVVEEAQRNIEASVRNPHVQAKLPDPILKQVRN